MKMSIQFEGGDGVNVMLSLDAGNPRPWERTFYAECDLPEDASEDYGYFALKAEILRQAAAQGVPAERLAFTYDGQEEMLAADAAADVVVRG